jgi:oxygen-independent coproporphyrinogen-3 oxidase
MAGIYIHIPFCKQACHYCDFHFSTSLKYKDDMLKAIRNEIRLQKDYLAGETIETIYLGGGTPSLLQGDELNSLFDTITKNHTVSSDAEITIEANPDDLDEQKVKAFKQTAINRFSIGIQSFFDEDLFWMNRAHRSRDAEASVKRVQDAGFSNITADLIYGYPLLTGHKWKHNLEQIFELSIPHISAYSITVEPKTALASFIERKLFAPMNESQSADQFMVLLEQMQQQGYEQYEISNFCLPGNYSRHNSNYWKGVKYLGVGPSAHSFNGEARQWNVANNSKYIQALSINNIPAEREELSEKDRLNEYIMTSLRTMWGLDIKKLESISKYSGEQLLKAAEEFLYNGWIIQNEQILTLTPEGKLYADKIASELFF